MFLPPFAQKQNEFRTRNRCWERKLDCSYSRLLDLICIKNSIIITDAMGCQIAIAKKIRENQADYILQLKNNQKTLLENIEDFFYSQKKNSENTSEDCGHGLVEARKCNIINDLEYIDDVQKRKDLQIIVKIESK